LLIGIKRPEWRKWRIGEMMKGRIGETVRGKEKRENNHADVKKYFKKGGYKIRVSLLIDKK
jgi:hypothetical protein